MTPSPSYTAFSIGFTEKTAQQFFDLLKKSKATCLVDVRLNNTSQLAGFAKKQDLQFFLKEICQIPYIELQELAPEPGLLKDYKNKLIDWSRYEGKYRELLSRRAVERNIDKSLLNGACLLCSEHQPHHCHRRVALDYLNDQWGNIFNVQHLY